MEGIKFFDLLFICKFVILWEIGLENRLIFAEEFKKLKSLQYSGAVKVFESVHKMAPQKLQKILLKIVKVKFSHMFVSCTMVFFEKLPTIQFLIFFRKCQKKLFRN